MNVTAVVAEKVLEFNLMDFDKIAKISSTTITIETHKLGSCFNLNHEELLLHMFETCYAGQQIEVIADDGENIERRGVLNFFENLCQQGIVPRSAVTFYTYHQHWNHDFKHQKIPLEIFLGTGKVLQHKFDAIDADAKFIGCLIGRFTPGRFDLAYQLDCAFPNNNFLTFRPSVNEVCSYYSLIDGAYQVELDWIKSKKFDTDEILQPQNTTSFISWKKYLSTYHTLWPRFQIECVAETDVFSNAWFTEKTARCLASGKPFVLFSGTGSLKTLQKFGFKTFNDIIDEQYDNAPTPYQRMTMMLQSLKDLYNSADKSIKINQLYQIAKYNQYAYDKICKKIRLSTST
jgi:hypothetical protein